MILQITYIKDIVPCFSLYAPVAQLVEHRPFKAGVVGSSPPWRTSAVSRFTDPLSEKRHLF